MLQGIGVSPGVVVGPAFLLKSEDQTVVERSISEEEIPREVVRLEEALIATRKQLHDIQRRVAEAMGQESASIFDAHLLVVDDRAFMEEVIRGLHTDLKNVDTVLKRVSDSYADALARIEDDYLRERAADVRDVARRILKNLAGEEFRTLAGLTEPCIVIAHDLAPSESAVLDRNKVIGFATDLGSPTSHTAIMARALDIPAAVGLHDISVRIMPGDRILIDGDKGIVIVHPTPERLKEYGHLAAARLSIRSELASLRDEPAETLDGYRVQLSANIELPDDIDAVLRGGARGVGLFRTEFIYLNAQHLPSEDEQAEIYSAVVRRIAPDPVIIRTLDLGGDKFLSDVKSLGELNPFMGWRAIRFCLARPDIFKAQLRAILRASVHGGVKIMYPMISGVHEVQRANELLEECKGELRRSGVPFDEDIDVGVMIEIPSAALTADIIAPEVDFFSVGTNDLVQYTMAVDRVNERIAYLYEPTHPAILKLLKYTFDTAHAHGIWVGVCGEMAGDPLMAPLLIGLGADELSVSPGSVPLIKDAIVKLKYSQAEQLADRAVVSKSGASVRELCRELIGEIAPEILELVR